MRFPMGSQGAQNGHDQDAENPEVGGGCGYCRFFIDSSMIFNECFGVPRFWYPQTPKLDPPQLPMEGHQGD